MKVLQIIDSLHPGGAERMAVSYANTLAGRIDGSYLCATRQEGALKTQLSSDVGYLFLKKKSSLDPIALGGLRNFIKKNNIDLIQAHGTSWFLAVLVKISLPNLHLIWHDHNGIEPENRKVFLLKLFSRFFDGVISVNSTLKKWALANLKVKKVEFFRNFLTSETTNSDLLLRGKEDFKIICVANFRSEKGHLTLLKAFHDLLILTDKKVSLHLIGKDKKDRYSDQIHQFIRDHNLKNVHIYGEQNSIPYLLNQADLGVLSSSFEGLPLALLEYGRAGLSVISTRVGQCEEVIGESGRLVLPGSSKELMDALFFYLNHEECRITDGKKFQHKIMSEYSENEVLPGVIEFFQLIIRKEGY